MTVKEVIRKLEWFDDDLEVVVQYRDGGGEYSGADKDIYLCQASVKGDSGYCYDEVYYGDNDAGKKVVVVL